MFRYLLLFGISLVLVSCTNDNLVVDLEAQQEEVKPIQRANSWGLNNTFFEIPNGGTDPNDMIVGCSAPASDCFDVVVVVGAAQINRAELFDRAVSTFNVVDNPQIEPILYEFFNLPQSQVAEIMSGEVTLVKVPANNTPQDGNNFYIAFDSQHIPEGNFDFGDLDLEKRTYVLQLSW